MDELERELRRVLRDDRWRLEPPTEAVERVRRGAMRRQRRRRAAAGGLSAFAIVAVASAVFATPLLTGGNGEQSAAKGEASSSAERLDSASPAPMESGKSAQPRRTAEPTVSGGPVPAGFRARSLTAVSTDTFWVLGTAPCDTPVCTSIVRTDDGGRTFRGLPAPRAPLASDRPTRAAIGDLRFASGDDGYAFGGALWTTHDGGRQWARGSLPGSVERVEAAGGTAWALVSVGDGQRLYRSPTSRDSWSRVRLPTTLGGETADLAVHGSGLVTVVGGSGDRSVSVVSTDGGRTFDTHDRPCDPALGSTVSATSGALWMFCATGTQGRPYVSTDDARSWNAVRGAPAGGWANSSVVGARSRTTAALASGTRIYTLTSGGATRPASNAADTGGTSFRFLGFTTPLVGYAVVGRTSTSSLWRTTDGGHTWGTVRF
ncbi:MAG: hypothetical protein GEV10_18525 [Streptosporangiales bacterium]|nr:hypothetical protein [Streptosporangiales bacterium]